MVASKLFTEEDLARHLQIMLRTHSELGYRPEQRFHLELGLLKMAHAQRLLPLEQLLSEVAGGSDARRTGKPTSVLETRKPEGQPTRPTVFSPFAADSARKSGSKTQSSAYELSLGRTTGLTGVSGPTTPNRRRNALGSTGGLHAATTAQTAKGKARRTRLQASWRRCRTSRIRG